MRYLSFILLGIFFNFLGTVEAQNQFQVKNLSDLENYLNKEINSGQIAGAEVLVYNNQKKIWHKALGYNNVQTKTPLEKNSIYFIQSMTKPIMSVAIMQLIEKGLLSLDDLAQDYIPGLADLKVIEDVSTGIDGPTIKAKQPITIKHLMTHTAGLSHGLGESLFDQQLFKLMYNDLFDPAVYTKLEEPVEKLLQVPLIGHPGEQWYYSAAPDILALVLQKITQQPIDEYLRENIFLPLGMTETDYNVATENLNRVMQVHLKTEEGDLVSSPVQVKTNGNTVYGGTYGLFSSTEDFLRFCKMILNKGEFEGRRVLSEASVLQMTKNQVGKMIGASRGFGLGFGVLYDTDKDPSPGSSGQIYWGGFFKTHFFIDPAKDLIAIFMTQKFPNSDEYIVALNRAVYGELN